MAVSSTASHVAQFIVQYSTRPSVKHSIPILPNNEFSIGRQLLREQCGVEDRAISNHHVSIRCVLYEEVEQQSIQPLVYFRVLSGNGAILKFRDIAGFRNCTIRKHHGDVLLSEGDVIKLTHRLSLYFQAVSSTQSRKNELTSTCQAEMHRFAERFYIRNRVLGVGGFATVHLAIRRGRLQQLACKIIPTFCKQKSQALHGHHQTDASYRATLAREYQILKEICHPNIITLHKVFCTSHNIYIFQELVTGGDLLSYLEQKGPLTEPQAVTIVRQILEAVSYLHTRDIVHRDIKAENVLLTSWRTGARIILTDFGQAVSLAPGKKPVGEDIDPLSKRMHTIVGTFGYMAPEVLNDLGADTKTNGYDRAVDMWSVGCLSVMVFMNEYLFPALNHETAEIFSHVHYQSCLDKLDRSPSWLGLSAAAQDFIRSCLIIDAKARLTAEKGLAHTWFTNPLYRSDLDAAYKRATWDWKPRLDSETLIEYINTSDVVSNTPEPKATASHHFQSAGPPSSPPDRITSVKTSKTAEATQLIEQAIFASPVREEDFLPHDTTDHANCLVYPDANTEDSHPQIAEQGDVTQMLALLEQSTMLRPPVSWEMQYDEIVSEDVDTLPLPRARVSRR